MNSFLMKRWPGVLQVAQLTRTVTTRRTGKITKETVYLITTLSPAKASGSSPLSPRAWTLVD